MNIDGIDKSPVGLMVAPATLASDSLTLVWDKPREYEDITGYRVYQNNMLLAQAKQNKTHFTVQGLNPDTIYEFYIEAITGSSIGQTANMEKTDGEIDKFTRARTPKLMVKTEPGGPVIDVTKTPYSADGTGKNICTTPVQKAIDDCIAGGTVLIPRGAVILTGALELKSNITLQVDGMLRGSLDPNDYIIKEEDRELYKGRTNEDGLILTRYEGWEMYCYRSLINAGYLNPNDRMEMTCENVRICGKGTIYGGGNTLGTEMKKRYEDREKYPKYVSDGIGGRRVRGRLLGFIQCKNVHLTGINIENPPCWTVHMIYCDTVTTHGVKMISRDIDNGDGWDPDSSRNLMIFDTTFDTGDDCIEVKSGKNPDGNSINIPTKNVRIFDLKMTGGHGMAIGSEQSGGVENVYMRDCIITNTNYGLELKAHNSRGGYIKNLQMVDCVIDRFMAHSVPYNGDGTPALTLPYFKDIKIKNTMINGTGRAIELIGFIEDGQKSSKKHYIHNCFLENVTLGTKKDVTKEIFLKACHNITFKNVKLHSGKEPEYIINRETVSDIQIIG